MVESFVSSLNQITVYFQYNHLFSNGSSVSVTGLVFSEECCVYFAFYLDFASKG